MGTHAELMETSEIYADIYRSQLVEDAHPEDEAPEGGSFLTGEVGVHGEGAANGAHADGAHADGAQANRMAHATEGDLTDTAKA